MSLVELREELGAVGAERFTASDYGRGVVTHIVLFRYRAETSAEVREEVTRRFHALAETRRDGALYIQSITSGLQVSGETPPGGFEQAFVVTFSSLGDRNYYVGEPVVHDPRFFDSAHAAFKAFVGPLLASDPPGGVLVFDFQ